MLNPWILLALVLGLVGTGASGYHMGYGVAEGDIARQRQKDIAAAWQAGRADLDLEAERARQAVLAMDLLATRLKAADRAHPVPPRPDRRWTDAERGLLDALRAAHLAADRAPAPGALHDPVPADAGDRPGSAGNGAEPAGLGLRLPGTPARMPRLGRIEGEAP